MSPGVPKAKSSPLLTAKSSHPKFRLSNLRIARDEKHKWKEASSVDWELQSSIASLLKRRTLYLIVRPGDGEAMAVVFDILRLLEQGVKQGTISGDVSKLSFEARECKVLSNGCEIYVAVIESQRNGQKHHYRVSNSAIHGDVAPTEPGSS